jgi:hypothetical protein
MGLAGLVGTGGPGERGEHDGIDPLAYTLHGCKGRTQHGYSLKASGGGIRRFFVRLSMGSGWSGDGETRRNAEKDGEVGKIGVAQILGKSSSKCGVTLQFLCTVVALVVFF